MFTLLPFVLQLSQLPLSLPSLPAGKILRCFFFADRSIMKLIRIFNVVTLSKKYFKSFSSVSGVPSPTAPLKYINFRECLAAPSWSFFVKHSTKSFSVWRNSLRASLFRVSSLIPLPSSTMSTGGIKGEFWSKKKEKKTWLATETLKMHET